MLRYLMPWIVSCVLITAPATAQAQAGDPAKVRALLAGVSAYPALDKKYQLPRAVQDARGLRDLLVTKLGVPAGNIQLLDNSPTLSKLREEWDKHLKKLKPGDVSIFYFSGHGVEDGKRPLLLTTEYKDSAYAAGFNLADELNGFAKNHGGSTGIFIIDACRNDPGAGPGKHTEDVATFAPVRAPAGTFVLYSAGPNQAALEHLGPNDPERRYSVYTRVLLELLEEKDRGLHEIAKDVRWEVYRLAQKREISPNVAKPHLQVPASYDEVLERINIVGKPLPRATRPPAASARISSAGPTRPIGQDAPDGLKGIPLWACRDCPEMVTLPVPSGPVLVGSPETEAGRSAHEGPPQMVSLNKKIAIGRFEVTRGEWWQCETSPLDGRCPSRLAGDVVPDDRRPMSNVSWDDAIRYADWLSATVTAQSGRPVRYRLPTEAEWEYAARAGSAVPYPTGYDVTGLCRHANGADASLKTVLWANISCDDGKGRGVTSVGSYAANAFGLHDMAGNVWEWVADCYTPSHAGMPADGGARPAPLGRCERRVAKGGSWRSGPDALRAGARMAYPPDHARATLGFRVAQDLDE